MNYIEHIKKSLINADNNFSKLTDELLNIEGMSGNKTRHLYNNLLELDDARYLEIGTWKGSSICSAMYKNKANIVCIDNWSEFGGAKTEFTNNFEKFKGDNNAFFIEGDCFKIDVSKLPKFNIFIYDGCNSFDSHYNILNYYYNVFDDIFIFIVNNWNNHRIRSATLSSIIDLNLKIIFKKELIYSNQDNVYTNNRLEWWNGMLITILQK